MLKAVLVAAACAAFAAGCSHTRPSTKSEGRIVTQIPQLKNVAANQKVNDWNGQGLVVTALIGEGPLLRRAAQLSAVGRLGWTAQGALLQVDVTDPTVDESRKDADLYQTDSVEFFLMSADEKAGMTQLVATPGRTGKMVAKVLDYRSKEMSELAGPVTPVAASQATPNGYVMEMLIPWSSLKITPADGARVGVGFTVNDSDGKDRARLMWTNGASKNEWMKLPQVQLAQKPSGAAKAAAWGGYDSFKQAYVNVIAEPQMAGRLVQVHEGEKPIATGHLAQDGMRAIARITMPLPPIGQSLGDLNVSIAGDELSTIAMPNLDDLRKAEFRRGAAGGGRFGRTADYLQPKCRPDVFETTQFPSAGYPEPQKIRDLVGPFNLTVQYYDNDQNEVTTAAKPGRYGAIIRVTPQLGEPLMIYQTLFRSEGKPTGNDAVRLAAQAAGAEDAAKFDRDWWHSLRKKLSMQTKYEYFARLPKSYDQDQSKRWPVIFYLHGSGGGEKMENVMMDGPQSYGIAHPDNPFIIVSLRSPGGWYPPAIKDVIDEVQTKYRTDPDRYYLTGFSMGGMGTWMVALDQPDRFAAIVPVGGRDGDPSKAARLKKIAVWVTNGAVDTTTTPADALKAVEALKLAGAEVKWTEIPYAGHVDSMRITYSWDELYEWFLKHQKQP